MGAGRAGRGRQAQDAPPTCGQLLQRYRVLAGLTQEELAERAGYSGNYIGKLEQDQRELPAAAADRLAAVLGLADQDRAALRAARERRQGGRELPARLLAGRDAEMAQIRQFLAGAGPPVLLLAGEPGMGKTRLLEEAASRAAGGGWGVARGGCLRRAQDAYAPLSGALDDALQRLPAGQRAEALRQAGRVDLLLPELAPPGGPGPGEGGAPAGVQPEQQRRLLVSSAGRLLRAVAGPAGTLLVLDDLHWAGPDAVDLLAALLAAAGSPPLRVIGAYRDSETPARLDEFVADLARASLVRVLPLGPLTDADAGRLLLQLAPEGEQQAGGTAGDRATGRGRAVLPGQLRRAGTATAARAGRRWRCRGRWHRSSASGWPPCPVRPRNCYRSPRWRAGSCRTRCWPRSPAVTTSRCWRRWRRRWRPGCWPRTGRTGTGSPTT